jgi:hypothetical protein
MWARRSAISAISGRAGTMDYDMVSRVACGGKSERIFPFLVKDRR